MRVLLLMLFATGGFAQPRLEPPKIGAMLDRSGGFRWVQGIAGSFVVGSASHSGVISAACSVERCLVKTATHVISESGERAEAPPGPAVFGLDGRGAWIYFPATDQFARWDQGFLRTVDWHVDGEVLSLRQGPEIAVRRGADVWITDSSGALLDSVAGATGAVLLLPQAVVFAASDGLVLRRQDRSELRFPLTGVVALSAMGAGFVQVVTPDQSYALRTDSGREQIFLLPAGTARKRPR
jgi:hypothetical protein